MVVDMELMALSDVAKLCGTSNSNVSNWRARDSTSAGPIWKSEDIGDLVLEVIHGRKDRHEQCS